MATDATFIDEASAVLRKLLQAHGREVFARANADAAGPGADVAAATAVTDAAITELVMVLDDRMQDLIVRITAAEPGGRDPLVSRLPESPS